MQGSVRWLGTKVSSWWGPDTLAKSCCYGTLSTCCFGMVDSFAQTTSSFFTFHVHLYMCVFVFFFMVTQCMSPHSNDACWMCLTAQPWYQDCMLKWSHELSTSWMLKIMKDWWGQRWSLHWSKTSLVRSALLPASWAGLYTWEVYG